ncbi:AraC family transcriptional regulator [Halalkalibaculum sp. DA384]|uniref:AraC family transcriptional regulator n=1 Tax=Halalkalibaculum sp. DA384 TaxID=3373606 RepID=UPI0037550137
MSSVQSIYFKLPKTVKEGFFIQYDELTHFYDQLHHHPELQLIYIIEGTGDLFIGDSISPFNDGSLFLIGANQNHLFKSDPSYFDVENAGKSRSISIFFSDESLGNTFFEINELSTIQGLIKRADRGIQFLPGISTKIGARMIRTRGQSGFTKFIRILKILQRLAESTNFKYLADISSTNPPSEEDSRRVNSVINYILKHYKEDIKLETIADIAHYSKAAFCKFFKKRTRKTFCEFLNEVRISQACKQLKKTDKNISRVGYECGYNNISHFNRQFKKFTGLTPREYIKKHENSVTDQSKSHYHEFVDNAFT